MSTALVSARTAATSTSTSRRKVEHLYWVDEIAIARALGLGVRRLCGSGYDAPPAYPDEVEVVGRIMPLGTAEDCRRCLVVLERRLRDAAS